MDVTLHSELPAPIESITIDHHFYDGPRTMTTLTAETIGFTDKNFFEALLAWAGYRGLIDAKPAPKKVILNAPATIVFFSDGSKVVSKAHGGDTFDPVFGIMACALRKTSNNRESIDVWEPVIGYLASFLGDADDCRIVARMLEATADALELDGVADAVAECDATEYGGDPIVGNDDDGRSTIRTLMYD